jgi:hypothetical protein
VIRRPIGFIATVVFALSWLLLAGSSVEASSLYTINGVSGGTIVNGYYTSPPTLTVTLDPSYPEPCTAQGGTVPGNGVITKTLTNFFSGVLNGPVTWQLLEDSISHALLLTPDGNWHDGNILDGCNWNGPNPNWQTVWSQTLDYNMSPPSVSLSSPANNTNTNDSTVQVSGTASSTGSGIKSVTVNGHTATVQGGHYSVNVPLNEGLNTLSATATDNAGLQAVSGSITVLRYGNPPPGSSNQSGPGSGHTQATNGSNSNQSAGSDNHSASPSPTATNSPGPDHVVAKLGNVKLTAGVVKDTGTGLVGFLLLVILFFVLDKIGLIEIKIFRDYRKWREKSYQQRKA